MCSGIMPLVSNGQYRIFNGKFTAQDIDLLRGDPRGIVGGYVNNSNSFNMVWNLLNVGNQVDQFTLTSAAGSAMGAYASINTTTVGAGVYGSLDASIWTIIPTPQPGQYWILAPSAVNSSTPSGLVLSLHSSENFAPIKLTPITVNDSSQVWTFSPQARKVGNIPSDLNDID